MATKHIIIYGDSRNMSLVPNESVQLIVTSPPYWQLKDYGVDKQIGFNDSYEGYEINPKFQRFYEEKVVLSNKEDNNIFDVREDTSEIDVQKSIDILPYRFTDIHK